MMNILLLCAVTGSIVTIIGLCLLHRLSRFSERTVYDVPELLRRIDEDAEQDLFDMEDEAVTRLQCGPDLFRRKQRYRLDLAAETYASRYHNQRIVLDWLNTEHYDIRRYHSEDEYGDIALEQMEIARDQGKRFCCLAIMIIVKIRVMGLLLYLDRFNLLHTPSVAALRKLGKADLLELYRTMKSSAVDFALVYGEEQSRLLDSRM